MEIASHLKKVGAISSFLFAGPLVSHIAKVKSPLVNPPTGALGEYWFVPALLVGILGSTFLPLLYRKKQSKWPITSAFTLSCAAVLIYGWSLLHFGRPIDIPRRGIHDFVVVGTERSDLARVNFDGVNDVDMLERRGWTDQELEMYWTKWSLQRARLLVLASFILTIVFINLTASTIAVQSPPKCTNQV